MTKPLRLAIIGAAGRGSHYSRLCAAVGDVSVTAVCDLNSAALERCRIESGATEAYTDVDELLRRSDCEAVLVATPMHLHAQHSMAALRSGRHVLSEVTAAVSLDECRALRAAVRTSTSHYMMAENYGYEQEKVLVTEMVRQGLFGEPYYAEGQYIHELKGLIEQTPWRRHWQAGLPGITYPTHSLGPILEWFAGDRVTRLTVADSGSHYRDPRGQHYHHDSATILAKTANHRQIELRMDLISDRPHVMNRHCLQGTDGCYESGRDGHEGGRLWCRSLHRGCEFHPLSEILSDPGLRADLLPAWYRDHHDAASGSGHGGSDWHVLHRFVALVRGRIANPCDIDCALDQTIPGLVSQNPLASERWLDVPNSRDWSS